MSPEERAKLARFNSDRVRQSLEMAYLQAETSLAVGELEQVDIEVPDGLGGIKKVSSVRRQRQKFLSLIDAAAEITRQCLESRDELGNPTVEAGRMARWVLGRAFPQKSTVKIDNSRSQTNIVQILQAKPNVATKRIDDEAVDIINETALRAIADSAPHVGRLNGFHEEG